MSIFAPSKNNAVVRLEHLLKYGVDPGQLPSVAFNTKSGLVTSFGEGGSDKDVDEPELSTDIEQVASDQITARIAQEFAGHGLATLVSALLTAEDFVCEQSPPGPDGGVDILAGRGPLGLDTPRLLVQVKSGGQIGAPVVTQLHGVMSTHGADQGLLVAWGGLSKPGARCI
jgi:restriction system protein